MEKSSAALNILLVLHFWNNVAWSAPIDTETREFAMKHLTRYHYLGENVPNKDIARLARSDPDVAQKIAIRLFQSRNSLSKTSGELNEETIALMKTPRCSNPDLLDERDIPGDILRDLPGGDDKEETRSRQRRYATYGPGWDHTDLTYRVIHYTPDLSQSTIDLEIRRALDLWQAVTPLTFTEVASGHVDIEIHFTEGDAHALLDPNAFDGPSGVLAHAYYPFNTANIQGDVHMDEGETWTSGSYIGINMLWVMVHEIGHSIGIAHSDQLGAIMYPYYTGYDPNIMLHWDDVLAAQSIYGVRQNATSTTTSNPTSTVSSTNPSSTSSNPTSTTSNPTSTPSNPTSTPSNPTSTSSNPTSTSSNPTSTTSNPTSTSANPTSPIITTISPTDFCASPVSIDAVTSNMESGEMRPYVFKGEYYAKLEEDGGIVEGYPKRISADWPYLNGTIDASLTISKLGRIMLFQGSHYFLYDNNRNFVSSGLLSELDCPSDVDAAFEWGGDGRVYVMKGNQYWKFKVKTKTKFLKLSNNHPKAFKPNKGKWKLPIDSIDGALSLAENEVTYFFKDEKYYVFDDNTKLVTQTEDIATGLLGCS